MVILAVPASSFFLSPPSLPSQTGQVSLLCRCLFCVRPIESYPASFCNPFSFSDCLQVDDFSADVIISQLLLLDAQDPTRDIKLLINSPGGSVTAGAQEYEAHAQTCAPHSHSCQPVSQPELASLPALPLPCGGLRCTYGTFLHS